MTYFLRLEGCSEEEFLRNYVHNSYVDDVSDSDRFTSPMEAMDACLKGLYHFLIHTKINN